MVADRTSLGPADHPHPHADAARTHHTRLPLSGTRPAAPSHFSAELRKLAREMSTPTDEYTEESEYEEREPVHVQLPKTPLTLGSLPSGAASSLSGPAAPAPSGQGALPMCPLEENRCSPGLAGPPGIKGTAGQNGVDGNDGTPGNDAMDELTPTFPMFCTSCPSGPDGKPGQPGPTGRPGLVGAHGIPGPNGKNGQPGAPGGYGSAGKQGAMGSPGDSGEQGQDGVILLNTKGPKGPPGKPGPDGQPGEDGTNNNTPGPMGETGAVGEMGLVGAPGLYGKRGETGEVGTKRIDTSCKCEDLMRKAIEVAENSAYVAVEAQARAQTAEQVPQDVPPIPTSAEIRRTPQKASSLAASGLPTLDELRGDYQKKEQFVLRSFAQEDGDVKKFAVAPSEVTVNEEPSGPSDNLIPELITEDIGASEAPESPEETNDSLLSESESEPAAEVTRPALFAPPRAQFPQVEVALNLSAPPKLHAAKFVQLPRVTGESRQRRPQISSGEVTQRKAEETTTSKRRRILKVRRVHRRQRHPAFRVFANTEDVVSLDEGEKPFHVEREIARESEKKVVNSREIRRSPKRLTQKPKNGKIEKKLRRVHVTPSKTLAYQHRENANILENIAKSLGLIEQPDRNEQKKEMNRVPIP
ncbi:unnamed protein product [Caenorhabditis sp. 36 PRJEB53466]|nr:unnamed protein product [Caenorhabditis sp. 36 PRJEB53466]